MAYHVGMNTTDLTHTRAESLRSYANVRSAHVDDKGRLVVGINEVTKVRRYAKEIGIKVSCKRVPETNWYEVTDRS